MDVETRVMQQPCPQSARARAVPSVLIALMACLAIEKPAGAASTDRVPPLPPPSGTIVNVSSEHDLQNTVASAGPDTTILIAPGTYDLTAPLYLNGKSDVTLRGATDNRDDVVLAGRGMTGPDDGGVPFGIWINGARITIANLTIRDIYMHPIIVNPGAQSPHIYNVHLVDAGEQFIKSNPNDVGGGVAGGIVEYCVFEYTTTARDDYTNGVDVHTGAGWIVRNNLFRRMTAPDGQLAGPAVLFWNGSSGAIVEGNTFIDCQREISMGLVPRSPHDNRGGIVRNNFIVRRSDLFADVAIYVGDSPDTEVLHNTVLVNGTYPNAIEYRFPGTTGAIIRNNLIDGGIQARDDATAIVADNYLEAATGLFVNAAAGDLHILPTAVGVIDAVPVLQDAPLDWDGHTRPQGLAADYGADEYVSPPSGPAQSPGQSGLRPRAAACPRPERQRRRSMF